MQALWGQSVVIDNRPGAGSNLGAAIAARAAPDGYTLMIGTDALMTSNVHLYKNMPFDPIKDFAPVAMAGANIICLAVHESVPVKTMPELIAYAKANPGKLKYGTPGAASPHHLSGELLALKAGIDIVHVPYKGGGPAANDLIGGHIPMAFLSLSSAVPQLVDRQNQDRRARRQEPLCRDARSADDRRDNSGIRNVVMARRVRARCYAGAAGCADGIRSLRSSTIRR